MRIVVRHTQNIIKNQKIIQNIIYSSNKKITKFFFIVDSFLFQWVISHLLLSRASEVLIRVLLWFLCHSALPKFFGQQS